MRFMNFSKLIETSSDCGSSNGLSQLIKQFGQDKTIQQEQFIQKGQSSKINRFRSSPAQSNHDKVSYTSGPNELVTEFFQQQTHHHLISEDWTRDFTSYQHSFNDDFESIYQRHRPWTEEFVYSQHTSDVSEQLAFERAFEDVIEPFDWDKEFANHEQDIIDDLQCLNIVEYPQETQEDKVKENETERNGLRSNGRVYEYRMIHPGYENYIPSQNNPYSTRRHIAEDSEHNTLADSVLASESNSQFDPTNAKQWEKLGLKQQENELDRLAISALEKAVSMDKKCLDAWLALAISYRNEHSCMDAYHCLEQWLINNTKYQHIIKNPQLHTDPAKRHEYITNIFLNAARICPGEEMDPDVQICLGLLFNISEEYDKAMDCFKSALITKPNDYQLWNKAGATLANARDNIGAIEMYVNAIRINPTYIRARYNLSVSYMNLGQYGEAAVHLLTCLSLQHSADDIPQGTNDSIWNSLRLLMYIMNFEDLATQCHNRNLDAFYEKFNF